MKKNRSTILLVGLLGVVTVGLPFYLSRQRAATLDLATKELKSQEVAFNDKVTAGAKIRKSAAEWTRTREILAAAMPPEADVQGAIRSMQALTESDGGSVRWLQGTASNLQVGKAAATATATATATAGATATPKSGSDTTTKPAVTSTENAAVSTGGFDLNINIAGTRDKVLAFVTKLEQKPDQQHRVFVVKNMTLTPEIRTAVGSSATVATGAAGAAGIPSLSDPLGPVKATIALRVTTFGSPVAKSNAAAVPVVAAGPQPTASSVPVVSSVPAVGS